MPVRGTFRSRARRTRIASVAAFTLSLALAAGTLEAAPASAKPSASRPAVQDDGEPARLGENKVVPARKDDPAKEAAVTRLDRPAWPQAASAVLPVGKGPDSEKPSAKAAEPEDGVGGLPVTLSATESAKSARGTARNTPSSVRVDVLDHDRAQQLGAATLLRVGRDDKTAAAGAVRLTVGYAAFDEAFGGSYGARLRLFQLPACAEKAVPGSSACPGEPKPLATSNDSGNKTLSADIPVPAAGTAETTAPLFAVAAGTSSSQGSYGATSLAPSASWSVSPSTGGFTWSYPLRAVPTPGGLTPSVSLAYASQSIDGRTSTTNNQGSWIGEGFSYEPGYIERRYKPCAETGHKDSAEQCWAFDNATVMLNGSSSQLVLDDETKKWHLSNEDGSKVEKLSGAVNGDDNGEHWKLTSADGTEYYFGLGRLPGWRADDPATSGTTDPDPETASTWSAPVFGDDASDPCYKAAFADAWCQQAWRWNLDYVKDPSGNIISYWYGRETNHYALNGKTSVNGTPYHRGGYLRRIEYGQRESTLFTQAAPARMVFDTAERCRPTDDFACAPGDWAANKGRWPDTPFDLYCAADTKCDVGQSSPSFWTRKRLTGVTTQMRVSATGYDDVDSWTFTHLFTDNGDDSKTLWLSSIDHTGKVGTDVGLPAVQLIGSKLENRVDEIGDNIAPLNRFRLVTVQSESGAQLDVNYEPAQCTVKTLPKPGGSTKRCYPVNWAPPGSLEPIPDWFHTYVVDKVLQTDRTGGGDDQVTDYTYLGDAAWRHGDPDGITENKYLSWDQWHGYRNVRVTSGDGDTVHSRIDYTYFQGMDGDKDPDGGTRPSTVKDSTGAVHTDSKEFDGFELETAVYDGDKVVSRTIDTPWKHSTATQTKSWGTVKAFLVKPTVSRGFTALAGKDKWRETRSETTYDTATGRVEKVDDSGWVVADDASAADKKKAAEDDTCTRTWYADSAAKNLRSLVKRTEKVAVGCADTPDRATQVISDERTYYDDGALDAAPTRGLATSTERLASHNGTTATYQQTGKASYDAFGRIASTTTPDEGQTLTAYTQTNGLTTSVKTTNALKHASTVEFAPAWGQTSAQVDANGKRTDLAFDGLGRITSVWLPDNNKGNQKPSVKYSYLIRTDKNVAVKTEKLEQDGSYGVEYQLYDSLMRPRQLQTEGPDGTRMMADTIYNGSGKVARANETYNAAGAPSDEVQTVTNGDVRAQYRYEYDGLGRTTEAIFTVAGHEQWRTSTRYEGDRTHIDPPKGGVPTTQITDAQGRTTELRQYKGEAPVPTGTADDYVSTTYAYDAAGRLKTVTDQAKNTWSYEYDQRGRRIKSVDPDSGTVTTRYDDADRPTQTHHEGTKKTLSTQYDVLGRPTFTYEGTPETGTKLTEQRYDRTGALGYAYASYRYVTSTDYFATIHQQFDPFYRPEKTVYRVPDSEGSVLAGLYLYTTTYNRDGTVQSSGLPGVGGLPAEPLIYGYDDLQRPTTMTGEGGYVTDTTWSRTSQLQQLELSTGGKKNWQSFEYEKGTERLTRSTVDVADGSGGAVTVKDAHYSYDQAGNVLSLADTADTTSSRTIDVQCFAYDNQKRLSEAWTPSATATTAEGSGTVGTSTPDYSGTRPSSCDAVPGTNPLGGPAPYWTSYSIDAIGNRTRDIAHDTALNPADDVTRTYTYADADQDGTAHEPGDGGVHAVTKVDEQTPTGERKSTYAYDAAGNATKRVIGGDTQTLTWDAQGGLTKVTEPDDVTTPEDETSETSYIYDAGGERVQRKDKTGTTIYLPGTELHLAPGAAKPTATRYYSYAGQTVAVRTSDGKVSFTSSDHHGTGDVAVDATTGAVTARRFDPYGNERTELTPGSGQWPGKKGFVGGTMDATTGLTRLGAREYDPSLGKFLSPDPVVDFTNPQQLNAYAYSNNSPVTHSDPTGTHLCPAPATGPQCDGPIPGTQPDKEVNEATIKRDQAQQDVDYARTATQDTEEQIVEIVKDIIGIDAAQDCLSKGDPKSCIETAFNVVTTIGPGILGKIAKTIAAPKKAYKTYKTTTRLLDELGRLRGYSKKAADKLDTAKERLKQAQKRRGKCETHSFPPGTEVLLAGGKYKQIKDVSPGDKVVTTAPAKGETTTREVVGTIVTEDDKEFVTLAIATSTGTATLTTTVTHPFWTESDRQWTDAGDLQPGMRLRTTDGDAAQVMKVHRFRKQQRTHDLTIRDIHAYYVLAGASPLLVHNTNISCPSGEGTTFSHFTDAQGVGGITGVNAEEMSVGQTVAAGELRFRTGDNEFMAESAGDIFVTDLERDATSRQLAAIGVLGARQNYVIQFSQEAAFDHGVRPKMSPNNSSIYTIPGGSRFGGGYRYTVTRVR